LWIYGNGGGNIWAMLAGVGPILGEGTLGKSQRYYEDGKAGDRADAENPDYAKTNTAPVHLQSAPAVAVLIDRDTGSSGEGIAIDFEGRPDTRFFGETTYGAATATFPYDLADGAKLYLVIGAMTDRNGKEYPNGVVPDQEVISEATIITNDPVIRAASDWLTGRAACRATVK
jgi:carboxyl-terminal processing protease